MSLPPSNFESNSAPILSNAAAIPNIDHAPSFQGSIPQTSGMPLAIDRPELPPRPNLGLQPSYGMGGMGSYNYGGLGGMGSYGMGGYGSYGMGAYGMGGPSPYGGYNRMGGPMYGGDIESRFIQMAEESSRPAFESIHGVVSAFGSIAMMMENTFFALTSSFRAVLGVAENFGKLRTVFAQVWSSLAMIKTINWLIRKLMVLLGLRTEGEFKAWAQAVAATQAGTGSTEQRPKGSPWAVMLFFSIITAGPYLIYKMLKGLRNTSNERLQEPMTWQNPLRAVAQYAFKATSPQELNFAPNQLLYVAPQHLQGNLWNSGWLMASVDQKTSGLIPVNYIKIIRPTVPQDDSAVIEAKPGPSHEDMEKAFSEA